MKGRIFIVFQWKKIIELSCAFAVLGFFPGIDVEFFIEFVKETETIQRVPLRLYFVFLCHRKILKE